MVFKNHHNISRNSINSDSCYETLRRVSRIHLSNFLSLFQRRSGKDRQDVQIMTLDEERNGDLGASTVFRKEGNSEILELGERADRSESDESGDEIDVPSGQANFEDARRRAMLGKP